MIPFWYELTMRPSKRLRGRLPPRKDIYIDVDGTLVSNGTVNLKLVTWMWSRHAEGYRFYVWSARGRDHAAKAVAHGPSADASSYNTRI